MILNAVYLLIKYWFASCVNAEYFSNISSGFSTLYLCNHKIDTEIQKYISGTGRNYVLKSIEYKII